jgi:hypothetical protein
MMKSMAAMAGQMGGGAGGTSAAGGRPAASPEAAAEMMKNMSPDQMKKMAESMKNMDPEMLKSAAKAAGMDMPNIDPAQMAQAAEAMGKMSPEQMEKMMVWAQRGQKCLRYITALAGLAPPATAVCRDGGVWGGGGLSTTASSQRLTFCACGQCLRVPDQGLHVREESDPSSVPAFGADGGRGGCLVLAFLEWELHTGGGACAGAGVLRHLRGVDRLLGARGRPRPGPGRPGAGNGGRWG